MALIAKGASFAEAEVNPFAPLLPPDYPHPFDRVPVLSHGNFTLYETAAITRYVDLVFPGPPLVPPTAQGGARMTQVIGIADAYAFRPLVLQVYAQRVFGPAFSQPSDEALIRSGLAAAPTVLSALDSIADEGLVLNRKGLTLADCHLAPMIAAFAAAAEGSAMLTTCPALVAWWHWVRSEPSFARSGRDLPLRPARQYP
jgi:glutathione S-transferase